MSHSPGVKETVEKQDVALDSPDQDDPVARVRPNGPPEVPSRETSGQEKSPIVEKKRKSKKNENKKGVKKCLGSPRGIETVFRVSYQSHIYLSGIADGKANIMISINGLIISIILAAVGPRLIESPWLTIPSVALLLTCLISIIFAVLSARPRVSSSSMTLEDMRTGRGNILFFGNFVNMPRADYEVGMKELLYDSDKLYHNMMRDLYGLGLVLQKKYRLLHSAYTVFMIGLVISVILFAAAFTYEAVTIL